MVFVPYINDKSGNRISVDIIPMSLEDAELTNADPKWQTSWTSDYVSSEKYEKYAVRMTQGGAKL